MMEFDEDIEQDRQDGNYEALALVAQDLRNILGFVAPRSYIAALKRKRKAENG